MLTQHHNQVSRAHRWAFARGKAVKRADRKLRAFEMRVAERAAAGGIPAGKLLVRGGFLAAKLAAVGALLFVGFWLLASVVTLIAVIALLQLKAVIETDSEDDDPGPDHLGANSYLGNYDDNGHYIGHFKSSNDVR